MALAGLLAIEPGATRTFLLMRHNAPIIGGLAGVNSAPRADPRDAFGPRAELTPSSAARLDSAVTCVSRGGSKQ
jgi:hypothetical protein